jgi:sigma-B regulation protein RsbU (phosphoserine phosphatase)
MLTTEVLEQIYSSGIVTKLFVEFAILLILIKLSQFDSENILGWTYGGLVYLILRDIAGILISCPAFFPLSTILIPVFLVAAVRWRTNPAMVYAFGISTIVISVGTGICYAMGILPFYILPLIAIISAIIGVFLISPWNIRKNLSNTSPFSIVCALLLFLVGPSIIDLLEIPSTTLVQGIGYPLTYMGFLFLMLIYRNYEEQRLIHERDDLTNNIDTLYNFVLNSASALHAGSDINRLMEYVGKTLTEQTNADGALVLMVDDFEDQVTAQALYGDFSPIVSVPEEAAFSLDTVRDWLVHLKVPVGEGIIGETAQSGKAVFIPQAQTDSRVVSYSEQPVGSLIIVPFLVEDRVIGVGVVTRKADKKPFTDTEFDRAVLLSGFAGVVINTIYSVQDVTERSDIDTIASIVEDIQKTLRPKRLPVLPNTTIGIFSESARGVCSDYYDIIPINKNRVYIVLGDIAGKGIQTSMVMVMIRAIIHLITNTNKDAATILSWINRGITGKIDIDHFATLQILIINPTTGACEYANAGHKPLLIWKQSLGLVDALETESVPIGVEQKSVFVNSHFTLTSDDVVLLYTDGVIEAINEAGQQYGVKSLTTILHKYHDLDAVDITQKVKEDLRSFMGGIQQHDDQTVLVIKTGQ